MGIMRTLNVAAVWLAMGGELFDTGWSVGDMDANSFTKFIQGIGSTFALTVISVIGFMIVVSSIAKNSAAGLYCTNPKLWDKVAVAKTRRIEEGLKGALGKGGSGNQIMAVGGSIETVILSLLPNIKAYTDFDGKSLDPKGYFMKAIPAMVIFVFIGALIFYGYPTKIAAKIAEVGTTGLDKVLDNFSPSAIVDKFTTSIASAEFPTDGAIDYQSKAINTVDNKVFTELVGHVSDITKSRRKSIGADIEAFVRRGADNYAAYLVEDLYSMTVTVGWHATQTEPTTLPGYHAVTEVDGLYQYSDAQQVSAFQTGTADDSVLNCWVSYTMTFKRKAVSVEVKTVPCKMYVSTSMVNNNMLSINGDNASFTGASKGTAWVVGSTGVKSFSVNISTNSIVFGNAPETGMKLSLGTAFKYVVNGMEHMITQIEFTDNVGQYCNNSSSDLCFVSVDDPSFAWTWGGDPLARNNTEE